MTNKQEKQLKELMNEFLKNYKNPIEKISEGFYKIEVDGFIAYTGKQGIERFEKTLLEHSKNI